MAQTETEVVKGIGSDYEVKYGFHDRRTTSSSRAAACRTSSSTRSRATRTSPTGCGSSASRRSSTSTPARCPPGAATSTTIDFDNIYYYIKPTEKQAKNWDDVPGRHQGHLRQARASPRPSRSSSPASARSTSPRSSTTAPGGPREAGRHLPRHGLGPARARGSRQASTSGRSSRRTTTSSRRSTRPSGRAARSSTCRRA